MDKIPTEEEYKKISKDFMQNNNFRVMIGDLTTLPAYIYVIDTGCNEIPGLDTLIRLNGASDNPNDVDGNHGTCVVNIAAKTATKCPIVSLKHGGGIEDPSIDGVIQCLKDVLEHYENLIPKDGKPKPRAVVNCSLLFSTAVIYADAEKTTKKIEELVACVQKLRSAGIPLVAAAGNRNNNLSELYSVWLEHSKKPDFDFDKDENWLPACIDGVITVGSYDAAGEKSDFSGHGSCVSFFCKGENLSSIEKGKEVNGTSFAAPLITALIACMLSSDKYAADITAENVVTKLKEIVRNKEVMTPKVCRMTVFTSRDVKFW